MNITLSQKDADFILKYIRMDARRVDERLKSLKESEERLRDKCKALQLEDDSLAVALLEAASQAGTEVADEMNGLKKDFTRCIELLTVGSEVAE